MSATTGHSAAARILGGAVLCFRDRTREHPERHLSGYAGILQAGRVDGYNRLYLPERKLGRSPRLCASHARRKFFELGRHRRQCAARQECAADLADRFGGRQTASDALDIEREINELTAEERLRARRKRERRPGRRAGRLDARAERAKLMLPRLPRRSTICSRWGAFKLILHDGCICLTNNAAERALRGLAPRRKSWAACWFRARGGTDGLDVHALFFCKAQ